MQSGVVADPPVSLIDRYAPLPCRRARYSAFIPADVETVYELVTRRPTEGTFLTRLLFFLRTFRWGGSKKTLRDLQSAGFGLVDEDEPREILLGVNGAFWRFSGNIFPFDRASFDHPPPDGTSRALWNFTFVPRAGGTLLSTETRILCGDAGSRRKFATYWFFVGPFSGIIRKEMLRSIRALALQASQPGD